MHGNFLTDKLIDDVDKDTEITTPDDAEESTSNEQTTWLDTYSSETENGDNQEKNEDNPINQAGNEEIESDMALIVENDTNNETITQEGIIEQVTIDLTVKINTTGSPFDNINLVTEMNTSQLAIQQEEENTKTNTHSHGYNLRRCLTKQMEWISIAKADTILSLGVIKTNLCLNLN